LVGAAGEPRVEPEAQAGERCRVVADAVDQPDRLPRLAAGDAGPRVQDVVPAEAELVAQVWLGQRLVDLVLAQTQSKAGRAGCEVARRREAEVDLDAGR